MEGIVDKVNTAQVGIDSILEKLEKEVGFPVIITHEYNPIRTTIRVLVDAQEIRQNTNYKGGKVQDFLGKAKLQNL